MRAETLFTRSGALEVLGSTLLDMQDFERLFGYVVGLVFTPRQTIDRAELDQVRKKASEITLGRFIHRIKQKEKVDIAEDLEQELWAFLEARNKMVHRLTDDPEFDLETEAGCRRLVAFLVSLTQAIARLSTIFMGFLHDYLEDLGFETIEQLRLEDPEYFHLIESLGHKLRRGTRPST